MTFEDSKSTEAGDGFSFFAKPNDIPSCFYFATMRPRESDIRICYLGCEFVSDWWYSSNFTKGWLITAPWGFGCTSPCFTGIRRSRPACRSVTCCSKFGPSRWRSPLRKARGTPPAPSACFAAGKWSRQWSASKLEALFWVVWVSSCARCLSFSWPWGNHQSLALFSWEMRHSWWMNLAKVWPDMLELSWWPVWGHPESFSSFLRSWYGCKYAS